MSAIDTLNVDEEVTKYATQFFKDPGSCGGMVLLIYVYRGKQQ